MNSRIERESDSVVTLKDITLSYNDWLKENGRPTIDERTFLKKLNSEGESSNFEIKKISPIRKNHRRSYYVNPHTGEVTPKVEKPTHIRGVKFKEGFGKFLD